MDREVAKVQGMNARLIALEGSLESLNSQHRKLAGKFHAEKAQREQLALDDADDADERAASHDDDTNVVIKNVPFCASWGQAQIEGPRSQAASCECDYCTHMRTSRRATQAKLVPKGTPARLDAIKRGLES